MKRLIIDLIHFYQKYFSPLKPPIYRCCYYPSCSQYTLEAVERFGIKGAVLGIKRVLSCHPWSAGGYEPVPKQWPGWGKIFH